MSVQKVFIDQPAVELIFPSGIKVQFPTDALQSVLLEACDRGNPKVTVNLNPPPLRFKMLQDYNSPGMFMPAGTVSRQMTEKEYEDNGVLPHLRTYGREALNYFKFKNVTWPVNTERLESHPDWFELLK